MTDSRQWLPRIDAHNMALGFIILVGLVARFTGIAFGLPHTMCRPDEATIIDTAWNVFSGDPNPHFFYYPSLYIYLLAGAFSIRHLLLLLTGTPSSDILAAIPADPSSLFLIARSISALFGAATPVFVYLITRKLWGKTTALIAALFASLCYLHVRESHFGTTDITAAFFTVGSVFFILDAFEQRRPRDYIRAGLFAGMAAATKYGSILVVLPMLAAHLTLCANPRMPVGRQLVSLVTSAVSDRRIWFYAAAVLVSFLAFTPFALFDFGTFIRHFSSEMSHLAAGHPMGGQPLFLGRGWWYHLWFTLPGGMGFLMFLSALMGMTVAFRKSPAKALCVFLFPLAYYALSGKGYTVFVRYMIPVLPFLCIASAVLVTSLVGLSTGSRLQKSGLVLLTAALLLPSLTNVIRFDRLLCRRDNRLVAADWLKNNVAPGKTIYQTGLPFGHVLLPAGLRPFRSGGGTGSSPDYILVQAHVLSYSRSTPAVAELLKTNYRGIMVFNAGNVKATGARYDILDAFYVPYFHFAGIERPGPTIVVFKRNIGGNERKAE